MSLVILACLVIAHAGVMNLNASDTGKTAPKADKSKVSSKTEKAPAAKAAPKTGASTKKVVVTGSRIPRDVKNHGRANATSSAVYVVDRQEIERSGAMTMTDLLRRLPFVR